MEKWTVLVAGILAIVAATPNILLYKLDKRNKLALDIGVATILIAIALVSYAFTVLP